MKLIKTFRGRFKDELNKIDQEKITKSYALEASTIILETIIAEQLGLTYKKLITMMKELENDRWKR